MQSTDINLSAIEYLRVSYDASGRERSPQEQHADNVDAAQRHGWLLGQSFKDIGSASRHAKKARADFDRLVIDLQAGNLDDNVLILWESSRGSRKLSEWAQLLELCRERKVKIYVTSDNRIYDLTNDRDMSSLQEDGIDSERESAKISKRAKRARPADAAAGRPNGPTPYGFRRVYNEATGKLEAQEPHPEEAPVVAELFAKLAAGHSLKAIAREFAARGIRRRERIDKETGKPLPRQPFSAQHLRVLALSHCYIGEREHVPDRVDRRIPEGKEPTYSPAMWPSLVSRETFFAVKRILLDPKRSTTRPGRGIHLLSMICVCDVCSGPLAALVGKKGREPVYRCLDAGHVSIAYAELNSVAEQLMIAYLSRKDNYQGLSAKADTEAAEVAREQVRVIRKELDDLADKVGRGELSAELAARAEPAIKKRLKAAEAREVELSTPGKLRGFVGPKAKVTKTWKESPMSAKRGVARILLSPGALGQLRVTRSPLKGISVPVQDRIVWRRES
jgi:DNA invertase Pin-like site-specific DNA recombinase